MPTAPHLYAQAHGLRCEGPQRCWYCGGPCGPDHPTRVFVRDTFTARDLAAAPGSRWVCPGCVLALRSDAAVELPDGKRVEGQKVWMWSWLITPARAVAYAACWFLGGERVRLHRPLLRALCVDPPDPPFVLVLAEAGRAHQLYRASVCHSRRLVSLLLDGLRVEYRPEELIERLDLVGKLVAAAGKPGLDKPLGQIALPVIERYDHGADLVLEWERVRFQPLTRLAAFLCPVMEECREEHPATGTRALERGDVPPVPVRRRRSGSRA